MKREIRNAEIQGRFSAASEDRGVLYRQVFDSMEGLKVPSDMADRIMTGLAAEKGNLPDVRTDEPRFAFVDDLPSAQKRTRRLAGRGKVIVAGFGKYAASIAACFVLAVGMFTLNSPAGQQIIGIGSEGGTSLTSEAPVKAGTEKKASVILRNNLGSVADSRSESGETPEPEDFQPSETEQTQSVSAPETMESNSVSSQPVAGAVGGTPSTEKKAVNPSESKSSSNGSAESRSSGDTAVSGSAKTPSSSSNGNQNPVTVPAAEGNPSRNQTEASSPSGNGLISDRTENEPVSPEEQPVADSPSDAGNIQAPVQQEPDTKQPFVFDSTHPVKELAGTEELSEAMGYPPALPADLPEGWEISSVEVIWGMTAQVIYRDGQNHTVLYRTSAGATSVSSDSGTYPVVKNSGIYRMEGDEEDRVRLITWNANGFSFSMAFGEAVSEKEALDWAERVVVTDSPS